MTDPIVGRWFHSFNEAEDGCAVVGWQGQVLSSPRPGLYLVQTYEWMVGEPSDAVLVEIDEMAGWAFYEDADHMRFAYEHGGGKAGGSRYHWTAHRGQISDKAVA